MKKVLAAGALLAAVVLQPAAPVQAQDNVLGGAIIGGGIGAIVGGAATGKAGGAIAGGVIGAAAGAMIGSQLEPRRGGYYWYDGRCWRKHRDGSYHRVSRRYCG
ncbi:MAG: glycine zipper domain-containing protein [Pseudolabrys sp.]